MTNNIEELFNEVTKIFNLKDTEFILNSNTITSRCDTSRGESEKVICILAKPEDAIHEGVHAFFEERSQDLWNRLGEKNYIKNINFIVTIQDIEEITARIIECNLTNKKLYICKPNIQDIINMNFTKYHYEDRRLGSEINHIKSIYDFYCIMPQDKEFFDKIKDITNPIEIYNIIAEYIKTDKLIV